MRLFAGGRAQTEGASEVVPGVFSIGYLYSLGCLEEIGVRLESLADGARIVPRCHYGGARR